MLGTKTIPNHFRRYMPTMAIRGVSKPMTTCRTNMNIPIYTLVKHFSATPSNDIVSDNGYYHGHLMTDHLEYVDASMEKVIAATNTKRQSRKLSTATKKKINVDDDDTVPDNDYYNGHLIADHLEYLDDMIEHTVKMNETISELQQTYDMKKQYMYENVNWMTSTDMQKLFEKSKQHKSNLRRQLRELQELYEAKMPKIFAVDAPDGTSDDMEKQDLEAVENIVEYAKLHENKDAIDLLHREEEQARIEALKKTSADGF